MSLNRSLMAVDLGRGTRRFQRFVTLGGAKPEGQPPKPRGIFDPDLLRAAIPHAFRKLDPRRLVKNPVMFVVEITAVLVTLIAIANADRPPAGGRPGRPGVPGPDRGLALVHRPLRHLRRGGRRGPRTRPGGDAAADALGDDGPPPARRRVAGGAWARPSSARATSWWSRRARRSPATVTSSRASPTSTRPPSPASPRRCSRSPGTDIRSSVTGGTTLTSDPLVIRVTTDPGETFLDRMIALVEGAKRQRTPNEIALAILLAGLTIVFLMATVTLRPFGLFAGTTVDTVALVALLVCLIPTTIGGLLSAIGIAGMDRVARFNVLAMSGRAVEASGDVDVILLDKTGTITYGNRLAASITAAPGVSEQEAVTAALVTSIQDETPEGRSIVELARKRLAELDAPAGAADEAGLPEPRRRGRRVHALPRRDPHQRRPAGSRPDRAQGRGRRHRRRPRRRDAGRAHGGHRPDRRRGGHAARHPRGDGRADRASSSSRTRSRRACPSASPSSAGWASARSW